MIAKNEGGESMADKRLIETNFSEGMKTETVYSVRGELPNRRIGDACRNIRIKSLKETNQGVTPDLFHP